MLSVAGLGPVRPPLAPGEPFPALEEGQPRQVNSPLTITVNGRSSRIVTAIGWPTLNNVYRIDFEVTQETQPGVATVRLSAAWMNANPVEIPVQSR